VTTLKIGHLLLAGRLRLAIADIEEDLKKAKERVPFTPPESPEEWRAEFEMLCLHCARFGAGCPIIEAMIEMRQGGPWPDGGWVTDPGAGVTCLSYEAVNRPRLPRQQLRAIKRAPEHQLPPVCGGCAALKGSDASVSLHTRRDFAAAVKNESSFVCHEFPDKEHTCGGWCRAIRARDK